MGFHTGNDALKGVFGMNAGTYAKLAMCGLVAIIALSGCKGPTPYTEFGERPHHSATALLGQHHIVGSSVRKIPIMTHVLGQGPDVVFILATIHGDEPAGTPIVRKLSQHLKNNLQILTGRTIVLLAVANPDGYAQDTRFNARGVDLNRNFPADNRINTEATGLSALSEPEARVISEIIQQYAPDRIVTLHQRHNNRPACIDYDGPAEPLAKAMAQHCDLPIIRLGAMPGSLGSYAGIELRIPIITFEMHTTDSRLSAATLWKRYGKALLAAITYPDPPR
jgi:protein MpaA